VALELHDVVLATGVTVSYATQGDAHGPTLLLIPGPSDSCRSYARVLENLPPEIHAVAMSPRGHGDSSKPPGGYQIRDFAADVVALLDALAIPRAVLCGHSGSCLVARRVAIDEPARVAGLVLEASPTTLRGNATLDNFVASVIATLEDPVGAAFARSFIGDTSAGDMDPGFLAELAGEVVKVPTRVWRELFGDLLRYDDMSEINHITAPTLLVWGDGDELVSRDMQEQLAAHIAGTELLVYPGVGHTPRWEEPVRFAHHVGDFVRRHR
jgi:non-heme chloroperoxidase